MFKLVLEKAEEPEIKLLDHQKSKTVRETHLFLLYWLFQSLCVDHNKLWKILKEMGIPDHLTCLLRNLYAGQEATVGTGHGTTDWFQIGKGVCQGCILSSCLFNLYAEYIIRNTGLEEAQAGIKISRRNINNSRYADDTTLMAESEEELKSLLMKVKEESEKVGWKLNIQKTKIMASGPITSWEIDRETVETASDFLFWGAPKSLQMVIAAMKLKDAYSLKGKQPRQHIQKQRHYFANFDSLEKTLMLGGIGGRRRRGRQRMRWSDGHESEWTPGVGDGQGGLACCNSWGHKESDMTGQLNWTEWLSQLGKWAKLLFKATWKLGLGIRNHVLPWLWPQMHNPSWVVRKVYSRTW